MPRSARGVKPAWAVEAGLSDAEYRLAFEHWGRGYASEAVRMMLELAFNTHQLSYVASKVARENTASRRVIEKNGGIFWKEDACGHFADALVYRFTRP